MHLREEIVLVVPAKRVIPKWVVTKWIVAEWIVVIPRGGGVDRSLAGELNAKYNCFKRVRIQIW